MGAIIVDGAGREIAQGYSREGDPSLHAEESALRKLGDTSPADLVGATIYSTLEPCTRRRSSPITCTQHILRSGIRRVVIAWIEPELFVADAHGVEALRAENVEVVVLADLADAARAVNSHLNV